MSRYVIGVDVGTGSARAGLFDLQGSLLASAVEPIQTWRPKPDFVEQSSENIWRAVSKTVRETLKMTQIPAEQVVGVSFDATCSLVVLDANNEPLPVNDEGDSNRNIIVWMDHRAIEESEEINAGGYEVLKYVGGRLSPEMETPKLKWLKKNLPETWAKTGKYLDLADFLTYRSTGVDSRSLCTVVCKWTYLGHEGGRWDRDYFKAIGIDDIFENERVSESILPMGSYIGNLTAASAAELGLTTGCAVGIGIIDAHAGGLGLMGAIWEQGTEIDLSLLETALALIGGTSNCHMAVSRDPIFIDGIWGPYFSAMVPGLWLTEGGQSAAGSAIDHSISDHANALRLSAQAEEQGVTVYQLLNAELVRLQQEAGFDMLAQLTKDIHVLPDFIGNRSPYGDPYIRGVVDGISLDESITSHALRYYATIQGVAYGTRDIVRAMNESGYRIDTMFVTGGGTKNPVWLQEHADATGLTLILPKEPEAVLLGSAILAATAAKAYPDIYSAMQGMGARGQVVVPNPETTNYHNAKFTAFREMYREQALRRSIMAGF
ncbi:MAG: FGGY-family carbohydrate kinase [Armatimonadetes bacterium]|nr:FGGY-family carbohydrate kinase [Armatimonadota bacterium]